MLTLPGSLPDCAGTSPRQDLGLSERWDPSVQPEAESGRGYGVRGEGGLCTTERKERQKTLARPSEMST